MARTVQYGKGKYTIAMPDTFQEIALRALRNSNPTVMRELERDVHKLWADAHRDWPAPGDGVSRYATGRSKKGLKWMIRVLPPNEVEGFVYNDALTDKGKMYVYYIKSWATHGLSTWVELVRKPFKRNTKKLVKKISKELVAALHPRGG